MLKRRYPCVCRAMHAFVSEVLTGACRELRVGLRYALNEVVEDRKDGLSTMMVRMDAPSRTVNLRCVVAALYVNATFPTGVNSEGLNRLAMAALLHWDCGRAAETTFRCGLQLFRSMGSFPSWSVLKTVDGVLDRRAGLASVRYSTATDVFVYLDR
jgi:hypothetical protein